MKRMSVIVLFAGLSLATASQASAESHRVSLHADFNAALSTPSIAPNLEFGAQYRFWGIFRFNASVFTNFTFGSDNAFNVASITPAGLFSAGFGMKIPLGGFALELGWSQFYTGFAEAAGVYHLSDSYSIGLALDLSDRFGVRVYNRSLYNFTDQALASSSYKPAASQGRVGTIGGGIVIHLL